MAGRCRYGDLMLAGLLLASEEPQYVRCQWTATHLVIVGTDDDDGFVVDISRSRLPRSRGPGGAQRRLQALDQAAQQT
jgi:hypothetical protein